MVNLQPKMFNGHNSGLLAANTIYLMDHLSPSVVKLPKRKEGMVIVLVPSERCNGVLEVERLTMSGYLTVENKRIDPKEGIRIDKFTKFNYPISYEACVGIKGNIFWKLNASPIITDEMKALLNSLTNKKKAN